MLERLRVKLSHGYAALAAVCFATLVAPNFLTTVSGTAIKPLGKTVFPLKS